MLGALALACTLGGTQAGCSASSSPGAAESGNASTPSSDAVTDGSIGTATPDAQTWWRPEAGVTWQWQLTGVLDTTVNAQMFDIDMFNNDASTIASLEGQGKVVVCYIDVGTWESDRPDSAAFPASVLGNMVADWPGELWLDIRSSLVQGLMQNRFMLAQEKGCQGIEPDNVDGYANDTGFPLTADDQLSYNAWVANAVHALGMSVALKNDIAQVPQLEPLFDFELDEQCFDFDECDALLPFTRATKAVLEVEYGDAGLVPSICPQADALRFDTIIKDVQLDAWRVACP